MISINGQPVEINRFPDGTLLIKEPPYDISLISWYFENNEELVTLIYIANHLRSHGVKKMQLYMPYIPNARQDRVKRPEDVFTLKYFCGVINSLGFEKVAVLDPHSSVSEALIENVCVDSPKRFIQEAYFQCSILNMNPEGNLTYLFFPDEGAMKRYSDMVEDFNGNLVPYTFGIKNRDWATGRIKGLNVAGDVDKLVRGHNILIVDDICSRGGTFYHSAKKLKELGANKIFLYVTHCENTILDGEVLTCGLIDRVYTTNSLFTKEHEKIEVINIDGGR